MSGLWRTWHSVRFVDDLSVSTCWRTCDSVSVQFVEDFSLSSLLWTLHSVQFVEDLSVSSLWRTCQCPICGGLISVCFVEYLSVSSLLWT